MKRIAFYTIIFITILVSFLAYHTYFENGWYVQDDYLTIEKGGVGSISHTAEETIKWLNLAQGRFQPVRLFFFSATTHFFQEESSVYYNFALHLANLLLLFLLLRKFSASNVSSLLTLLLFSLYGRYRMMESPSTMIGGDGLNLFFILLTVIFLIKSIEENDWDVKKIIWYCISLASYAGLVFSYEVAFPLILVVIYTFIIFHKKTIKLGKISDLIKYAPLLPYVGFLLIHLKFFRNTESGYEGAKIVWGFDILTRFKSYLYYATTYPLHSSVNLEVILFLLMYFVAIFLAVKADITTSERDQNNYKLLAFGVIFYLSSVILFTLNSWGSATSIMYHHTYVITAGSSIFMVSSIAALRNFVSGITKKILYFSVILLLAPYVLAAGLYNTIQIYKIRPVDPGVLEIQERTASIKIIKNKILSSITDPQKIDAILIKNFADGYYGISSMDGAYLQWFDYKKHIHSGREIISVLDNKIKFRGPLTYYHPPNEIYDVENDRAEIFYLNEADKKLLSYSDNISLQDEKNLHQLDQVMGDDAQSCDKDYVLNALFKNVLGKNTLIISLDEKKDIKSFLREARIEINGRSVKNVIVEDNYIFIPGVADVKYLFLKITSVNNRFKSYINEMKLSNNQPGTMASRLQVNDVISPSLSNESLMEPAWEWGSGFYGIEKDKTHNWRWASPSGDLFITNSAQQPLKITFEMHFRAGYKEPYLLAIKSELWNEELRISSQPLPYKKTLLVPSGKHLVKFETNSPKIISPNDPRNLSYMIENFKIAGCSSRLNTEMPVNDK